MILPSVDPQKHQERVGFGFPFILRLIEKRMINDLSEIATADYIKIPSAATLERFEAATLTSIPQIPRGGVR